METLEQFVKFEQISQMFCFDCYFEQVNTAWEESNQFDILLKTYKKHKQLYTSKFSW